jgi:serine/threonine protein kinase
MAHTSPHPFTTGLKFAFQSENNLYIGMSFLCGGNLKQLIQRFGSLPEPWVCFYAAELILAIAHLHSMQVLYRYAPPPPPPSFSLTRPRPRRDIKPHNVMIDAEGHLVLIDYGLAKQDVSHPNGAISLVGTPDYSAPEILKTAVFRSCPPSLRRSQTHSCVSTVSRM